MNPRPQDSYRCGFHRRKAAFAAFFVRQARAICVCGPDCPFTITSSAPPLAGNLPQNCEAKANLRRCPSSLYTFRRRLSSAAAWLGIGIMPPETAGGNEAFPEFEQIHHAVSKHDAQFLGILCSIQLSYADFNLRLSSQIPAGAQSRSRFRLSFLTFFLLNCPFSRVLKG